MRCRAWLRATSELRSSRPRREVPAPDLVVCGIEERRVDRHRGGTEPALEHHLPVVRPFRRRLPPRREVGPMAFGPAERRQPVECGLLDNGFGKAGVGHRVMWSKGGRGSPPSTPGGGLGIKKLIQRAGVCHRCAQWEWSWYWIGSWSPPPRARRPSPQPSSLATRPVPVAASI